MASPMKMSSSMKYMFIIAAIIVIAIVAYEMYKNKSMTADCESYSHPHLHEYTRPFDELLELEHDYIQPYMMTHFPYLKV